MAVASRKVEYAQKGGVAMKRVVDVVVDPTTGLAAEKETIALAVPTEDGNTAIIVQERITATQVVWHADTFCILLNVNTRLYSWNLQSFGTVKTYMI